MKQVKVKKLHPFAELPKYATDGSGCFDLQYCRGVGAGDKHLIEPFKTVVFPTRLAFEIPEDHVMLLFSRSGHGRKGIKLANSVGVIDSDYRGEVKIMLHNNSTEVKFVESGERIAQAMIIPVPQWKLVEAEELSETVRGSGGFGSTGK